MEEKLKLIMDKMNKIDYPIIEDTYVLQSPQETEKIKQGICWDQVELERYYFEKENIKCYSYFIVKYDNKVFPTHTFMVVEDNDNYYWFEHSWEKYKGIYKYESINSLLKDVYNKFRDKDFKNNIIIYKYDKPKYGITSQEFFSHCEGNDKIILE